MEQSSDLTLFVVDSPVKTLVVQGNGPGWKGISRAFGGNLQGSFAIYDPNSSLWKMCQRCLFEGSKPYSGTWPRAGMMRSGTVSQRRPSVPLISVTGFSLLPTPTASVYTSNKSLGLNAKVRFSLSSLSKQDVLPGHYVGLLDPRYIEWMMGFPAGWTEIEL